MALVPLNFAGGSFEHKSRPLSSQHTRNFWAQVQANPKEKSKYILQSFYGLKLWKAFTATSGRGFFENQGSLYRVADTTLYKVASDGTHTAIGAIPGSQRCIIDGLGSQITVVTNRKAFNYDGTATTQITSANIGTPQSCASINNQMLYDNNGDVDQIFNVSDVGDATSINGLNNASAESLSDPLRRVAAFTQTAYMMGAKNTELWWDSGQGNPPFDRVQQGIINTGLDAIHSVAYTDDFLLFFGNDNQVHSLTGGLSAVDSVISTPAQAKQFKDYAVTSDAIGWTMKLEGQWFYVITFPTQNITWTYPIGGEPFEWGTGTSGRIRANSYAYVYGKHLVEDYASGNIYELDAETYTDVGETIVRTRDSAPIHGGLFQADGKDFEINSLEIILETGVGLISGQGSEPLIAVSVSRDGGKTFGNERMLKVGGLGMYRTVRTGSFGRFKDCCIRLRCSDPIFWSIHSGVAYIDVCI